MKISITSALAGLTLSAGLFAGQAQAHTEWRFPHKSAPYAVPHTHSGGGYAVRNASECPRTVIRRSFRSNVKFVCSDK